MSIVIVVSSSLLLNLNLRDIDYFVWVHNIMLFKKRIEGFETLIMQTEVTHRPTKHISRPITAYPPTGPPATSYQNPRSTQKPHTAVHVQGARQTGGGNGGENCAGFLSPVVCRHARDGWMTSSEKTKMSETKNDWDKEYHHIRTAAAAASSTDLFTHSYYTRCLLLVVVGNLCSIFFFPNPQ